MENPRLSTGARALQGLQFSVAARPRLPGSLLWTQFRKNVMSTIGLCLLVLLMGMAIFAPFLSPYDPDQVDLSDEVRLQPPSAAHWFGTDHLGRDVFTRSLFGGRISMLVGFISTTLAIGIGILIGCLAGFYGGLVDNLSMRLIDLLLSLPLFFVIVILQSLVAQPSILTVVIVIGLTSWMGATRVVRGQILKERETDYVLAAYSVGVRGARIMRQHLIPNVIGVVIVAATLQVGRAILLEASLSYLGFGLQPPTASWGSMLTEARGYLNTGPWMAIFPGILLSLTILSFNFVGDGLAAALDPHSRK